MRIFLLILLMLTYIVASQLVESLFTYMLLCLLLTAIICFIDMIYYLENSTKEEL